MSFRAVQNGGRVLILVNGKLAADLDAETTLATSRALHQVGKLAQEYQHAETVIDDSAVFLRMSGLGLAYNRAIAAEAHKRAQWDSKYRKGPPAIEGIPSATKVGRPELTKHERKGHG